MAASSNYKIRTDSRGFFGEFGGAYIPEMLHFNVSRLQDRYFEIITSTHFQKSFSELLRTYSGRPTPLTYATTLSKELGAKILLKREDLNHTGAHKITNALGQVLLARNLNKTRIIAETGAGQHGVATATACALMKLECIVYMGVKDIERQAPNVKRMKMLGARVEPVYSGSQTLKDATNEAIRDWINNGENTHYLIGSTVGPHPYPDMVAMFQSVISDEIIHQMNDQYDCLPDKVIACIGGGSNAAGAFYHFLDNEDVTLIGVEAAGKGLRSTETAASASNGTTGILHGCKTLLLQNKDGQINEAHSVSAGLDYPGIGPMHADLITTGRVELDTATDDEALEAAMYLARAEGIIPALESSHAIAALRKIPLGKDEFVVLCLSGRGDKDMEAYSNYMESKNIQQS